MKSIFFYIVAFMLALPAHPLSYVKTVLHVTHHDHDEEIDHDHYSVDHDAEELSSPLVRKQDFSHNHAPGQPVHSHEKDVWGLFANPALNQSPGVVNLPAFVFLDPPVFKVDASISDPICGSLLRPPIA
jgi:hypothetical protein